jgi:predicted secreted protein
MGRSFTGCAALLVALGVVAEPAQARDRKSSSPDSRELLSEISAKAASSSAAIDRRSGNRNADPMAPLAPQQPATDRNPLSLKLGAVTLQPAVGGIKGAQVSIGS